MDLYQFIQKNREVLLTILIALFTLAASGFLLFHIAAEGITIVIAVMIFNYSRKSIGTSGNSFVFLLGCALAAVSIIDFLHVLTYYGMGVLIKDTANKATQLWLAGRYILSLSLLFAPFCLTRKFLERNIYLAFTAITMAMVLIVFFYQGLPDCLTPARGLTTFKIYNEYIVIGILLMAFYHLRRNQSLVNRKSYLGILAALAVFILTEICFTLYINVYSIVGILGHMFKVFGYILFYYAIIVNDLNDLTRSNGRT
ncbi:MAG: MASE3 domain-containing protein [Chitinophagales bacterium]